MTIPYTPPGVTVDETTTTTATPLLSAPGSLCLIGLAAGTIQRTDTIILNGTVPSVLLGAPIGATLVSTSVLQVLDAINPSIAPAGYSGITDYTFTPGTATIARQVTSNTLSGIASSGQAVLTLAGGPVPAVGQVVSVGNTVTTVTGNVQAGSTTITGLSTTTGLAVGQTVVGNGVAGGSTITSVNASQSFITVSSAAITTGTTISLACSLIELGTVLSVVGQVVTLTANLAVSHASTSAVTWGTIPDGSTVYVTYTYAPIDYFQPILLNNLADIQTRFGNAMDPTGNFINSSLSYAALNAFANGATNIVVQPFYVLSGAGVRVQPTAAQFANAANWGVVYNGLKDVTGIAALTPVIGQSMANVTDGVQLQVFQATQDFIEYQKQNDVYAIAFLGEDSSASSSVAQDTTLISHAQSLQPRYGGDVTKQLVLINTASFTQANQVGTFNVGGQYMAAAIAGMMVSRDVSATLTRQVVSGFTAVADVRTKSQKNNDAANSLLVVESKSNVVQIRHSITLDASSVATQELSVVNAKFLVIESIQLTLDSQIIGRVVATDDAPTLINNVVIGTLETLRGQGDIGGYSNVLSANVSLNPTVYAVSFAFQPLFPIDYIHVTFSLDLTSASITVGATG